MRETLNGEPFLNYLRPSVITALQSTSSVYRQLSVAFIHSVKVVVREKFASYVITINSFDRKMMKKIYHKHILLSIHRHEAIAGEHLNKNWSQSVNLDSESDEVRTP